MNLQDAIKTRKSTKSFFEKKVDWKKIIRSIDLARFVPMAGNIYSLKYIIVENKMVIEKITNACQQDFVRLAGAVIIVVSDREKVKKLYDYKDKGFAQQQAGAAIQTLLLALTENKIDNCWIGFFDDNLMKAATKVPESMTIEAIIALGTRSKLREKQRQSNKIELENIVFFESWGNNKKEPQTKVKHDNI